MGHDVDGQLASWDDVAGTADWSNLLLGNGFSINLWADFKYTSLFKVACTDGHLSAADQSIFAALGTENFEIVLSGLSTAIVVATAVGAPTDHLLDHYTSVQQALGRAVKSVHPPLEDFDLSARRRLRAHLAQYRTVFTTGYDMLLYWCAGAGDASGGESFEGFKDRLWSNDRCEFDPGNADIFDKSATRILYLHGALHLVVDAAGTTWKTTRGPGSTILDHFGVPDTREPTARPLLISEGDTRDKLKAIQDNDYLLYARQKLRDCRHPLVVFGHRLGDQDAHLAAAIDRHPGRRVAVSLIDEGTTANRSHRAELRKRLPRSDLYFYDAATHPLGSHGDRIARPAAAAIAA